MATQSHRSARKQTKRTYRRHGDVVKLAAQISGRSIWTVYAVLSDRVKSAPVQRAIELAREQLRVEGRPAA